MATVTTTTTEPPPVQTEDDEGLDTTVVIVLAVVLSLLALIFLISLVKCCQMRNNRKGQKIPKKYKSSHMNGHMNGHTGLRPAVRAQLRDPQLKGGWNVDNKFNGAYAPYASSLPMSGGKVKFNHNHNSNKGAMSTISLPERSVWGAGDLDSYNKANVINVQNTLDTLPLMPSGPLPTITADLAPMPAITYPGSGGGFYGNHINTPAPVNPQAAGFNVHNHTAQGHTNALQNAGYNMHSHTAMTLPSPNMKREVLLSGGQNYSTLINQQPLAQQPVYSMDMPGVQTGGQNPTYTMGLPSSDGMHFNTGGVSWQ